MGNFQISIKYRTGHKLSMRIKYYFWNFRKIFLDKFNINLQLMSDFFYYMTRFYLRFTDAYLHREYTNINIKD